MSVQRRPEHSKRALGFVTCSLRVADNMWHLRQVQVSALSVRDDSGLYQDMNLLMSLAALRVWKPSF